MASALSSATRAAYAKFVSGSGVGNAADTTNDTLWAIPALPAGTLASNGDSLVIDLVYQTGATGNNKNIGFTVNATQVNSSVITWNANSIVGRAILTRVDSTHVNFGFTITGQSGATSNATLNLVVADLTANTISVTCTGTSGTTGAANDVKLYSGIADIKK